MISHITKICFSMLKSILISIHGVHTETKKTNKCNWIGAPSLDENKCKRSSWCSLWTNSKLRCLWMPIEFQFLRVKLPFSIVKFYRDRIWLNLLRVRWKWVRWKVQTLLLVLGKTICECTRCDYKAPAEKVAQWMVPITYCLGLLVHLGGKLYSREEFIHRPSI